MEEQMKSEVLPELECVCFLNTVGSLRLAWKKKRRILHHHHLLDAGAEQDHIACECIEGTTVRA